MKTQFHDFLCHVLELLFFVLLLVLFHLRVWFLTRDIRINRRSINSEIILCIEKTIRNNRLHTETLLTKARNLRERTSQYTITDDEFDQAKMAGRP